MMRNCNHLRNIKVIAGVLALVLSGCSIFTGLNRDGHTQTNNGMNITFIDAYQGVKDGNVEWVPLPEGKAYITVEACIENPSVVDRSIQWQDVFLTTEGHEQTLPVALGYDQAEAFSWLLPITEPIGGKHIDHKFYFFVIQNNEIMKIPAYQSLGCSTSAQFKRLAFLFIVNDGIAGQPLTLHFLDTEIRFEAKRVLVVPEGLKWGVGPGLALILMMVVVLVIRKRKIKAQVSLSQDNNPNRAPGEL